MSEPSESWPRDKREMVDALLFSLGVPFGVAENISVKLHDGLRIDTRTDRLFELAGKKTALFFQRPDPEIVKALQETQGVRAVATRSYQSFFAGCYRRSVDRARRSDDLSRASLYRRQRRGKRSFDRNRLGFSSAAALDVCHRPADTSGITSLLF